MARVNSGNWVLGVGIDPNPAIANLDRFTRHLRGKLKQTKHGGSIKSINMELSRVEKLVRSFRSDIRRQRVNQSSIITHAVKAMGERLLNNVLVSYDNTLEERTGAYRASITMSLVSQQSGSLMIYVGDIIHMMEQTDIMWREKKSWNTPYTGHQGPWRGYIITGYWYLLEYGFRKRAARKTADKSHASIVIRKPIFENQDYKTILDLGEKVLDRKINSQLKRWGREWKVM